MTPDELNKAVAKAEDALLTILDDYRASAVKGARRLRRETIEKLIEEAISALAAVRKEQQSHE